MGRFLFVISLQVSVLVTQAQNSCQTVEYMHQALLKSPDFVSRMMEIENFTQGYIRSHNATTSSNDDSGLVVIPVVVHILYNNTQQNISDAQVKSQIAVLNQDYIRRNADTVNTPARFKPVAADCGFQFELAKVDPNGYATTGIIHKQTDVQSFGLEDGIKFSSTGGDDGWDRDSYLNIWVGNLTNGFLGYSSVVGGPVANDGVVVLYNAFGVGGSAVAPFDKGRTTTHEIGHWMNLIHTWGDAFCGNDYVADTPPQQAADYGSPSGIIITCNNAPLGNMYQNYMDFSNDASMNLFTQGQKQRMIALFQPGGPHYAILSSTALTGIPLKDTLSADEGSGSGFSVSLYPNPSTDHINVNFSDNSVMGSELEIFNQLGIKLSSSIIQGLNLSVNVSSFPKGLYFVRVNKAQGALIKKFIKL